jgi:hypothetical protein
MTEDEEREVVRLLRNHQAVGHQVVLPRLCDCGWWEQDGFDIADHQARLIRNLLGHEADTSTLVP